MKSRKSIEKSVSFFESRLSPLSAIMPYSVSPSVTVVCIELGSLGKWRFSEWSIRKSSLVQFRLHRVVDETLELNLALIGKLF